MKAPIKITRENIIDIAVQISDLRGLNALSMKEIAEKLTIKTPSLYNHVASLEEVYDLLVQRGLAQLMEEMKEAAFGLSGKNALYAMSRSYRKFALENRSLYESVQMAANWGSGRSRDLSDNLLSIFYKIFSSFDFSEEESTHYIRILRSYLHGFSSLNFGMDIDVDKSFETGLKLIIENI